MALLLIGGGWFGFQEMQTRQIVEKRAGACAAHPCGPGYQCDGSGGCIPKGTTDEQVKSGEVKSIDPPEEPWRDPDGDGVSKPNDNGGCPTDTYQCGGGGLAFDFCLSKGLGKSCIESALEQGYTVPIAQGSGDYGSQTWFCKTRPPNGASCDGNHGGILRNDLNSGSCFCGVLQVDTPTGFKSYQSNCGCGGNDQETTVTSPSPSPGPGLACVDLTANTAAPKLNDTVTFTCQGVNLSSAAPVAQFRTSFDGGTVFNSPTSPKPINLTTNQATEQFTVSQVGNWEVQCRICTDSTVTTCTAWGLAQ